MPLCTDMDDELLYFTPTSPIVSRSDITPFIRLTIKITVAWRPGTTWKEWLTTMVGKYIIDCHLPNPWPRTLDDSIYEDLFSWWGPAWLFGEHGLSTQPDDEVLRLYDDRLPSLRSYMFVAPTVPMFMDMAVDDELLCFTTISPIVSRRGIKPFVPLTEKVLAAWKPGTTWRAWKADTAGEYTVASSHSNPWPRTLDYSIYEDLFRLLGPSWLFGENGLSTQSDAYVQNLHSDMLPEILSLCCAACSQTVVRVQEPSAWPRSLDKHIYNDLYRLWGPTWLHDTWFSTSRIPMVAAGLVPTALSTEFGFLHSSDPQLLEAHGRLLPAIQQLPKLMEPLPHCWAHWNPGMEMSVRGLHGTFGWYWSEDVEDEDKQVKVEEASSRISTVVPPLSESLSEPQCVKDSVTQMTRTTAPDASPMGQTDDWWKGSLHTLACANLCPRGIIPLSARAYRANRLFCGDPEVVREADDEPPLSFCAAYFHLYNVRVNRPIELGHGLVRVTKFPWYRPKWRRPGSHRRRPWPGVPTMKGLSRYAVGSYADPQITNPVSAPEMVPITVDAPLDDVPTAASEPLHNAPFYSALPESAPTTSKGCNDHLARLQDTLFTTLCTFFRCYLLALYIVTWRHCWPLTCTLMGRLPRATAVGVCVVTEELHADLSCLGRGLWSIVTSAATLGRAVLGITESCCVSIWRSVLAMEGVLPPRIDSDSLAFCHFLLSVRALPHVSLSAVPISTEILTSLLAFSVVLSEAKLDRNARLRHTYGPQFTQSVGMYSSYEGAFLLKVRLRTLCADATRMSVAMACALEYDKRVAFS